MIGSLINNNYRGHHCITKICLAFGMTMNALFRMHLRWRIGYYDGTALKFRLTLFCSRSSDFCSRDSGMMTNSGRKSAR